MRHWTSGAFDDLAYTVQAVEVPICVKPGNDDEDRVFHFRTVDLVDRGVVRRRWLGHAPARDIAPVLVQYDRHDEACRVPHERDLRVRCPGEELVAGRWIDDC